MQNVAIFGSTGSIGTQALEVIAANPHLFKASILSAHNNDDLLIQQANQFKPATVIITNEAKYQKVKDVLAPLGIAVHTTEQALIDIAAAGEYDILLAAIVGFAGLQSTLAAAQKGKTIALANKETLVVGGDLMAKTMAKTGAKLIPVDSEHSAIYQCLVGEDSTSVEKIILTASGGPFLGKKPNFLINVRRQHALQHPNWVMGAKITIDSATLMNKGLEMIEAKWLFNLKNEQIEAIIHPQSIIHSMVQFIDGSMKAQMGLPDMKLPIQYAMGYPTRIENAFPRLDFRQYENLTFEQPDIKTFRNLAIAQQAMFTGGNAPCVLNAANEAVVDAFLHSKITFLGMSEVIEQVIAKVPFIAEPTLQDYIHNDHEARIYATELAKDYSL